MKKKDLSALLTLLAVVFFGCGAALLFSKSRREPISRSAFLLNTFVNITLYDSQDEAILDHCVDMCQEYENRFSKTIEGSELYKLNHRSADETTFTVSDDMAAMISEGLHYSEVSHGAYDLTIEPLSSLWNFTSDEHVIPAEDDITAAAERVNWKNVKLDGNTLTFLSPDTTIDLGSIAKGYIADKICASLIARGAQSGILDFGGAITLMGEDPDGRPWLGSIADPRSEFDPKEAPLVRIQGRDLSIATSSIVLRSFEDGDELLHHVLDPKTGMPRRTDLLSASIISASAFRADCLSTIALALGMEGAKKLISREGVEGVLVQSSGDIYLSSRLRSESSSGKRS